MKRQKIILELSNTELNQLLSYITDAERKGWYYGNRKQFDARHLQIKEQVEHSLPTDVPITNNDTSQS